MSSTITPITAGTLYTRLARLGLNHARVRRSTPPRALLPPAPPEAPEPPAIPALPAAPPPAPPATTPGLPANRAPASVNIRTA
jgi:hypothetical protein